MSSLKEIRRRITSVGNTKQITRAMKLVSAAKLKRAQGAAENGRSFEERLDALLKDIQEDLPEGFSNPLLEKRREIKRRRIVMIAGERGLCGAYNTNVVKAVRPLVESSTAEVDVVAIGRRAKSSAHRFGWNLADSYEGLSDDATLWPSSEIAEKLVSDFIAGECDEVVLVYTKFKSAMTQIVTEQVLLPFTAPEVEVNVDQQEEEDSPRLSKYDPRPEAIVSQLVPLLVTTKVCQAGLESKASEHGARMTAMDSATRNANELIDKLKLYYNRARQSAITTELIDIVGGAEALK